MTLIAPHPWLVIASAFVLGLFMVHAMMELTVSLLVQRPRPNRKPIAADDLRQRLLALSNPDQSYRLVEGKDCDLEIYWEMVEAPRPGRFAIARGGALSHLRCLLDEQRHELRMNQVTRSYSFFLGLAGWLPRFGGYFSVQAGPPGHTMTAEISQLAARSGWAVRPVVWWFQATHRGYRALAAVTPAPLRRWPARRFWGIVYPVSFFALIAYLMAVTGGVWDARNLTLLGFISAIWWGVWGFLVWAILGFPAPWRRQRRM